jgi:PST family polysaccharide transporter
MKLRLGAVTRHSVFRNTAMLFLVQLLNYVMPLVLIPFLARALGVETYGIYAFGMSIYLIGLLLIDYGFPVQGLYAIAEHRADRERVARLMGGMLLIKLGLFAILAAALGAFALLTDRYAEHRLFLMLSALPLLGAALQFRWFFQGIEQSGSIFRYALFGRVAHVVLVIALVSGPQDYLWAPIGHGLAQIAAGLMCVAMIRRAGYRIGVPERADVAWLLRSASSYFWAAMAGANLGFVGVFVLGFFVAPAQLAVYAASEQLYRTIRSLYYPLADALMPYMRRNRDVRTFRRLFLLVNGITLVGVAGCIALAPQIIGLLFGDAFGDAVPLFRIMLTALLFCVPSIMMGYPLLGAMGHGEAVNRIVIWTAIASTAALGAMALTGTLTTVSVALTIVASEAVIFAGQATLALRVRAARRGAAVAAAGPEAPSR